MKSFSIQDAKIPKVVDNSLRTEQHTGQMAMEFPSLDEIVSWASNAYEADFIRTEFGPGLGYYLLRLDRLMLSGEAVLDAGCGVGQWSVALSQRFKKVEALDLKPERLEILERTRRQMQIENIHWQTGSIEELPFKDQTFNAVFCYGVIMFTNIERALAEFIRVLRPGGRLYVCLNGEGWSRRLIANAIPQNQTLAEAGRETLYATHWARAVANGMVPHFRSLRDSVKEHFKGIWTNWSFPLFYNAMCLGPLVSLFLKTSDATSSLEANIAKDCGPKYLERLRRDVLRLMAGRNFPTYGPTRAYQPAEIERLLGSIGFSDFQWGVESGLICNLNVASISSRYEGYYGSELAVWEFLANRSKSVLLPGTSKMYQHPSREPMALGIGEILSNSSRNTYPLGLLQYHKGRAAKIGGAAHLRELAKVLIRDSKSEEESVRRLIVFVQRALFRDPVSQPLEESGALPDPLVILLCGRGRCGHAAELLIHLCHAAGLEARRKQLPRHIIAEVQCGGRWVLADADTFKNGIVPVNREGRLISWEDLESHPYLLDRFPPTGWCFRPGTRYTQDCLGNTFRGYVDALEPEIRGFASGYFISSAEGHPPPIPTITSFSAQKGFFHLEWTPVEPRTGRLSGYRVNVGTTSRGWHYNELGCDDEVLGLTGNEILSKEVSDCQVTGRIPNDVSHLYAAVTAVSDRIELEPETYFWPSEEARYVRK